MIVCLLKMHFFTPILDCEKSTEYNWVSDQTWWLSDWGFRRLRGRPRGQGEQRTFPEVRPGLVRGPGMLHLAWQRLWSTCGNLQAIRRGIGRSGRGHEVDSFEHYCLFSGQASPLDVFPPSRYLKMQKNWVLSSSCEFFLEGFELEFWKFCRFNSSIQNDSLNFKHSQNDDTKQGTSHFTIHSAPIIRVTAIWLI